MEKQQELDYDLVIVGGNIVGATLACALQESGLKILVVESKTVAETVGKQQAYAFSILSSEIYSQIGVWQDILPQIGTFKQIRLSDANYSGIVQFYTEDLGREHLGYVAEHSVVLETLYKHLQDNTQFNWQTEVQKVEYQDTFSLLTLTSGGEQRQVKAKLIVAADGAKSQIRTWAGIKTRGWKYWQSCVTCRVKHQASRNDIAFERFWKTGPMGVLPLPDNQCQIVWTNPHAVAKSLIELNEQDFLTQLQEHTGGLLGELEMVSPRGLFPVQLMQSDHYVLSRLALVGDAAHCCHPVGGQGLNLGIRDAAALAQVLQQANSRGQDIGDIKVLKRYERWRKLENLVILGFTDLLDRVFSTDWLIVVLVRRIGLQLMKHIKPLKLFSLKLMTGLQGKQPEIV